MQLILEITPEQKRSLIELLTKVKTHCDASPQPEPSTQSQLTDYSKQYLTIEGLQNLAKTEYQQFTTQERTILNMANKIRAKELTISPTIDAMFANKNPKSVANTLCNGNARIMVANQYLVRNGLNAFTFEEAYIKSLKNKGFLPDALSSCNNSLYGSLLSNLSNFTIKTEHKQSNFYSFIATRPNQLIRVWTYKSKDTNGNFVDTHATMLYYVDGNCYCVDTAVIGRNSKIPIDITNLTTLHDRRIDHLETLDKA